MGIRVGFFVTIAVGPTVGWGKPAFIVQPGAPAQAALSVGKVAEGDVVFMQGMIHNHSQAVEMVNLLLIRGSSRDLLALGERITISQSDEMRFMMERGKPVSMEHDHAAHMAGGGMPLMPGMLTAA